MNEKIWWYLSRSSGIVALVLLVLTLVWGVLLATRVLKPFDRPAWLLDLHRWLGGTAIVMTALHMFGLFMDGWIDFGFADLFVPGASDFEPVGVAIGVLSMYVMVAIQATSYMRRRLSARTWRAVHVLSYGLVWSSAIHAGMSGTDTANRVYQALAILLSMIAVVATVIRSLAPTKGRAAPAAAGTATATATR